MFSIPSVLRPFLSGEDATMVKRMAVIIGVLLAMPFLAFPQERGPRESYSSSPPLAKTEAERKILARSPHALVRSPQGA